MDQILGSTPGSDALHALGEIGQLYGLEKTTDKLSPAARQKMRAKHASGRLAKFKLRLNQQVGQLTPKHPLRQAAQYALNHWESLCRYTEDGHLSIDNNLSERTIRCVAIGRKTISCR